MSKTQQRNLTNETWVNLWVGRVRGRQNEREETEDEKEKEKLNTYDDTE